MHFAASAILLPLCVSLLLYCSEAADGTVPAVFAFGDSILDTGNNNQINTLLKSNAPPYGRDFPGGKATGRFSDGKVLSDLIAEGVGVKGILPAFRDPYLQDNDLATGVCFASAGSGLDSLTNGVNSVLSMEYQLNLFKNYISKLQQVVGEERANSIISNSLFLVSSGNNDIAITYYSLRLRMLYDISSYTSLLVTWASDFVKNLHNLGARKIAFLSTLPLGCLPSARSIAGGLSKECADYVNNGAQMFNTKLASELSSLNNSLADSKIFYLDVYSPLLAIIQNPETSGFQQAARACCGTGTFEVGLAQCNQLTPLTCNNASRYVFWDAAHPSERADRIVASQLLQNYARGLSG